MTHVVGANIHFLQPFIRKLIYPSSDTETNLWAEELWLQRGVQQLGCLGFNLAPSQPEKAAFFRLVETGWRWGSFPFPKFETNYTGGVWYHGWKETRKRRVPLLWQIFRGTCWGWMFEILNEAFAEACLREKPMTYQRSGFVWLCFMLATLEGHSLGMPGYAFLVSLRQPLCVPQLQVQPTGRVSQHALLPADPRMRLGALRWVALVAPQVALET